MKYFNVLIIIANVLSPQKMSLYQKPKQDDNKWILRAQSVNIRSHLGRCFLRLDTDACFIVIIILPQSSLLPSRKCAHGLAGVASYVVKDTKHFSLDMQAA